MCLHLVQAYITHIETSPLPVKGCSFKAYPRCLWLLSKKGSYRAIPAMTQDLSLYGLIRRKALFSRLLRHVRLSSTFHNPDPHGLVK